MYSSGIDSLANYKNMNKAITYPYPISYEFNSRGFRGKEWPKNLSNVIWCIGDSFTTGIGVPFEHTWPTILQQKSGIQCINLGIDGAANNLIANIAKQVITTYNPKYIAIMWSFPHRRYEDPWKFTHFTNASTSEDLEFFKNCFNEVNSLFPSTYNTSIPEFKVPNIGYVNNNVYSYTVLDLARDNYHFDYLTAEVIAESVIKHYNLER